MNPPDSESGGSVIDRFDWHEAIELVDLGQYDLVAKTLRDAQLACDQSEETVLSRILNAANQICQTCDRIHAEQTWYVQAAEEAQRREGGLRHQLQAIFNLFDGTSVPETSIPNERVDLPSVPSPKRIGIGTAPNLLDADQETPKVAALSTLLVYCLGRFRVFQNDQPIEEWTSNKGKSVFKYLITHRTQPVAKEVLMEIFWPSAEPEAARNNLNVAIYGLRRSFHSDQPYILFRDDQYLINPEVQVWIDAEQYLDHARRAEDLEQQGRIDSAVVEYRKAAALYQGEYLEEDRYEEWLLPHRQHVHQSFLRLLDRLSIHHFSQEDYDSCAVVCNRIIAVDSCHEKAHRRLMRCYSRQGQRYLAVRQYHHCVEALNIELDVGPSQKTMGLYEHIQRDMPV